jgi:hypothetical protein
MSEMVDRVADAIWRVNKETTGLRFTDLIRAMAIAAINAMREPTDQMVDAVYDQADPGFCDEPGDPTPPAEVWHQMIDAALTAPSSNTDHPAQPISVPGQSSRIEPT